MTLTTFVQVYSTAQAFSSSYRTSQQLKVDVPRMEKEWFHISFLFFMEHLPDASSSCKLFLWIWRLQVMLFLSVAWQQKGKNRCGDEWRWARGRQEERKERGGELESQALVVIFSFSGFCGSLHFPSRTFKKKSDVMCCWALDDNIRGENISH